MTDIFNYIADGATTTVTGQITLDNPGTQTDYEGDDVVLELVYTAPTNSVLSWMAGGLPPGLSIDPGTGVISGEIPVGAHLGSTYADIGRFTTVVTVADGEAHASIKFRWSVRAVSSVTLATPANQSDEEGDSVSLSLSATGTGTIRYFAIGLPPGLTIRPTTGVISGTRAVNDAALSPFAVEVIATNGTAFASQQFTWAVGNPISISTPADQTGTESGTVSLSVLASGGGTKVDTAVGLPPGLKMNPTTGAITGTLAGGAIQ